MDTEQVKQLLEHCDINMLKRLYLISEKFCDSSVQHLIIKYLGYHNVTPLYDNNGAMIRFIDIIQL